MKTKKFVLRLVLALAAISAVAISFWAFFVEPGQLTVRHYTIRMPRWPSKLNGLKLAVISDLHVGCPHVDVKKLEEIIDLVNAQQPDLVLMLGDYVSTNLGTCAAKPVGFAQQFAKLKPKIGTYGVLGNHDWWYDGSEVRTNLEGSKVVIVDNAATHIEKDGETLFIAGLADAWTRRPNLEAALSTIPDDSAVLLLTHNPDVFPNVPASVSLTLAGHTHGGQVSLPFIGAPIVPSNFGSRYAKGLIVENGKRLFVSSGIGTSVLPVRLNVPPEISIITLDSQ